MGITIRPTHAAIGFVASLYRCQYPLKSTDGWLASDAGGLSFLGGLIAANVPKLLWAVNERHRAARHWCRSAPRVKRALILGPSQGVCFGACS
jgi:hypothetical protein